PALGPPREEMPLARAAGARADGPLDIHGAAEGLLDTLAELRERHDLVVAHTRGGRRGAVQRGAPAAARRRLEAVGERLARDGARAELEVDLVDAVAVGRDLA